MGVAWGFLSTADDQREGPGGRAALGPRRRGGGRQPLRGAGRGLRRASTASRARTPATRRCWTTPRWRRSTSRCPTRMHVPGRSRALEAGKHVLCEKPMSRRTGEVEAAFAAAERSGRLLIRGVHVPPPPADPAAARARGRGRHRPPAAGPGRLQLRARRPEQRPALGAAGRRGADGRRLLLRERRAPAGRRARARPRRGRSRAARAWTSRLAATLRFPGDVLAAHRRRAGGGGARRARGRGRRRPRSSSTTPGTPREPVIELRARRTGRAHRGRTRPTPTSSSSRTSPTPIRGEAEPLLGRADALVRPGPSRPSTAPRSGGRRVDARPVSLRRRHRRRHLRRSRRSPSRETARCSGAARSPTRSRRRGPAGPSRTPRTGGGPPSRRSTG